MLVMGSHRVFDVGIRIVGVLHCYVPVAVAQLRARHGGRGRRRLLRVEPALVLVVPEACGRLRLLLGLPIVVPGRSHLRVIAIVPPRAARTRRLGIRLPLIHGNKSQEMASVGLRTMFLVEGLCLR
jgi:hypothetical protein